MFITTDLNIAIWIYEERGKTEYEIQNSERHVLGVYSTEKNAMDVLYEICKAVEHEESVFEMPQDSEMWRYGPKRQI